MLISEIMCESVGGSVKIDNVNGAGAVPYNQDIDYFGFRVLMKPSTFLKLALPLEERVSVEHLVSYMRNGGAIGSPFLQLRIPDEWEPDYEWNDDGNKVIIPGDMSKPAKIAAHEGRNRMTAIMELYGDDPVEVHILPGGGYRASSLTPEMIADFNTRLIPEGRSSVLSGPFFKPI